MNDINAIDRCYAFINSHLQPARLAMPGANHVTARAVTISRQAGCGALVVAEKLAALLQKTAAPGAPPWTVFDRNLMEKVLEDHHLPARLAQYLPEDRITQMQDIMDELFGLRPPSDTIVRQVTETVLRLAELGSVILIGRGGNIITARVPGVFHVRLVAPLERRIQHAHEFYHMDLKAAREFCEQTDLGRKRYLKKYFDADVADPLQYHLTVNTGLVSYDEAARLIAEATQAHPQPAPIRAR